MLHLACGLAYRGSETTVVLVAHDASQWEKQLASATTDQLCELHTPPSPRTPGRQAPMVSVCMPLQFVSFLAVTAKR